MDYQKLNSLTLAHYKNSTEVVPGSTIEDVVKACLFARLNIFFLGETGEGKTQLENDVLALFGNKGFFEQGRNDLTIKEMFTRLNLEKIRTAKRSDEIKEVTEHLGHPVYVIDELTRCIPAVQNQFFNLFDGFVTIDGVKHPLGDGYSIGVASGNSGMRYMGTSEMDRALKDRMHVMLDVDYFYKSPNDSLAVLVSKYDPRVNEAKDPKERTKDIRSLHEEFVSDREVTIEQYCLGLYLMHGLDYLEGNTTKRQQKTSWPGCVKEDSHEKGSDAAVIFPFSQRSTLTTMTLASALEMVRKSKGNPYDDSVQAVLDAAYIVGAQSGVLHPMAVETLFEGNPYAAMQDVMGGIRSEYAQKKDVLHQAIGQARKGKLAHLDSFSGRWGFMKDVLQRTAHQR
jgi:hypothetical protein